MTNQKTYSELKKEIEDQDRTQIYKWFKYHVATLMEGDNGTIVLKWYKPGTSNYSITYIFEGRYVMAIGDLGDSVWAFSQTMDLWEIPNERELGYFMSKLRCSDSKHLDWNRQLAMTYLEEEIADTAPEDRPHWIEANEAYEAAWGSRDDWMNFLQQCNSGFFGNDPSSFSSIGDTIGIHHRAQFLGLIMAREQIKHKESKIELLKL